ncbi:MULTISPECIES: thioesterase family protein [unclassified Gordonia (in: high G+C Gram-positive bacteria)]|uniref:thioesterase family protein n=1 Tax=unclassified Gordonia (in: high G+C Gram-positive bacteria) TaxID=2657482 RepID=UPI001FFE4761|nr:MULTISPECIES: thioesterase family protein [unclassified Gordonia (in: high G+C Gram-positive bacteria)]UQE76744.1 thioesterase family protein [Gordonia sp. PP30]
MAADSTSPTDHGAYYLPLAAPDGDDPAYDYFQPTPATVSVWSPNIQHGGPPTGLLVRAMEGVADPADGQAVTRVTMEILGAIGLDVNRVRAWIPRPGRQISQVAAELEARQPDGSYRVVGRAVAWRLKVTDTAAVERLPREPLSPSPADVPHAIGFPEVDGVAVPWGRIGFIGTIEVAGAPGRNEPTPAVWLRPLLPLVAGSPTSPLASAFTVVDVANGVGSTMNPSEWSWMNTDTTVHLTGQPTGEWIGIDSAMAAGREGYGASFAELYDERGYLGRSAQTVLLTELG